MKRRAVSLIQLACQQAAAPIRAILLTLALTGYAVNAAQAHIISPQDETIEILVCGTHGDRVIEMNFGDENAPIEFLDDSCCDPCLGGALPNLPVCALPGPVPATLIRAINRTGLAPRNRVSIWPGAPPHGPPGHLKT